MSEMTGTEIETPATDTPETDSTPAESGKPENKEQRYRREAREAQAERDALRSVVDRYRTAVVERIAGEALFNGADLFLTTDLASLLDDEGSVDEEKVRAATLAAIKDRPHWANDDYEDQAMRGQPRSAASFGRHPWDVPTSANIGAGPKKAADWSNLGSRPHLRRGVDLSAL